MIIQAWKEAAKYTKNNRNEIIYDKRPIIDLTKQQRTYRASRGKAHTSRTIKEYTDWNGKENFNEKPIKIPRNTHTKLRK